MQDPAYEKCLEQTCQHYSLRKQDVNNCSEALYHNLSKYGHGNTHELVIRDTDHTMTEIASIEAIFGTLKVKECFRIPVKVVIE